MMASTIDLMHAIALITPITAWSTWFNSQRTSLLRMILIATGVNLSVTTRHPSDTCDVSAIRVCCMVDYVMFHDASVFEAIRLSGICYQIATALLVE